MQAGCAVAVAGAEHADSGFDSAAGPGPGPGTDHAAHAAQNTPPGD